MSRTNLLGLSVDELITLCATLGERSFRARQIYHGMYRLGRSTFGDMTDLSIPLRKRLAEEFEIRVPKISATKKAADETEKYLLQLSDGETIEMVAIPERERSTLCISTQVGCNAGCRFCVTATMGLRRNLTAGEIVGQVLFFKEIRPEVPYHNVVFMGMGEPLLNYEATMKAIRLLSDPGGIGVPSRRMTLSTCGIVPGLEQLATEATLPRVAISLGAPEDALRTRLIPVGRKWDLKSLMQACRILQKRTRVTFEYTLIHDVNDSPETARQLVRLLHGMRSRVNLIPLNPHPTLPYERPRPEAVHAFREILVGASIPAFVRRPRGEDIWAACGQLATQTRSVRSIHHPEPSIQ